MKLIYNGTDIAETAKLVRCELEQYLTGHVGTLSMKFNNSDGMWTGWAPVPGDVVRVSEEYADSGTMIVHNILPGWNDITIRAAAVRYIKEGQEKRWKNVSFMQLIRYIASRTSLTPEFYGVEDHVYRMAEQKGEGDLAFLDSLCKLEGCCLQVFDGRLIVISGEYLESIAEPQYTIEAETARIHDDDYFSGCVVSDGNITGKYGTQNGEVISFRPNAPLSSIGEANRFAKNMLAYHNNECKGGEVLLDTLITEIMPGSKVLFTCRYWEKKPILITRTRHDLARKKTKVWFRLTGGSNG